MDLSREHLRIVPICPRARMLDGAQPPVPIDEKLGPRELIRLKPGDECIGLQYRVVMRDANGGFRPGCVIGRGQNSRQPGLG